MCSAARSCCWCWGACWLWSASLDGSAACLTPAPTDCQPGSQHPNKALHWTADGCARASLRHRQPERLVVIGSAQHGRGVYGRDPRGWRNGRLWWISETSKYCSRGAQSMWTRESIAWVSNVERIRSCNPARTMPRRRHVLNSFACITSTLPLPSQRVGLKFMSVTKPWRICQESLPYTRVQLSSPQIERPWPQRSRRTAGPCRY